MPKIISLPDGREAEFPDNMDNAAIESVLQKQFAPEGASSSVKGNGAQSGPAIPEQPADLEQILGPSDFTKAFASTPARMLKSTMQMIGAGDYVPDAVSRAAAEGDKSTLGRIAGDVAGTSGIAKGAGALAGALDKLHAAKGVLPAIGRTAEAATYGGVQGAVTSPDDQADAAKWGAAGGAVVPVLGGALNLAGKTAANVLGGTTGAGTESVRQAFRNAPGFKENMRGAVEPAAVVEQARAGIQNMRNDMHATYQANKAEWAGGQPLDFGPVLDTYNKLAASFGHEGFAKIGPAEQRVVAEIDNVLNDFWQKPALHTTEGFDALKQRLQAIYPESPQMRQAQRAVSTMANAVKETIAAQNPKYATAMKDYWNASRELDEIERSLSLGNKATTDTALRKLQSLMRNNANTNYGQRLQSAGRLATQGGEDVLPAVAGQAMNDWLPRGISRGVGAAVIPPAVFSGGLGIPAAIGSGMMQSPRLVGETVRGVGMLTNNPWTQALAEALRRFTPAAARSMNRKNSNE